MIWSFLLLAAPLADDVLIADFEGTDYGGWKVEGTAFGSGPAPGTLPGQMEVTGFLGRGLVNSFSGGDDAVGALTSPEFVVERPFVNFLVGGGGRGDELYVELSVDGKSVRKSTGPNIAPGGSERLDWDAWDVKEFRGKTAVVRIVDRARGGWGHINVDHLVQSERPKTSPAVRTFGIDRRFLRFPVRTGAAKRMVKISDESSLVRKFEIELADGKPDFTVQVDVSKWRGKTLTVDAGRTSTGPAVLAGVTQSDDPIAAVERTSEHRRPAFHFTAQRGWLNDPNGLVYAHGEWHLFFQHNPYGWNWGNMHWGHAVSKDLVRWEELGDAIFPHIDAKEAVFSGSAVVDTANVSGFGTGTEPPLVAAFTDTGAGEALAYSNDRGRTWSMYHRNPVVKHTGRDPKLVWHKPSKRWIMAVYDEEGKKQLIAFYSSPNLRDWTLESKIDGWFECPDLFEIALEGSPSKYWILYAADGEYAVGKFDGKRFVPMHQGKRKLWYGDFYAAQTYDNAPDGRRVQIGWGRNIEFPGAPFNQQMTIPVELTLRPTADGPRMHAEPVKEVETLRKKTSPTGEIRRLTAGGSRNFLGFAGLLELTGDFQPSADAEISVTLGGREVRYDAKSATLSCNGVKAPAALVDGKLKLRMLLDRGSLEVFANDGAVAISRGYRSPPATDSTGVQVIKGMIANGALTVYELAP